MIKGLSFFWSLTSHAESEGIDDAVRTNPVELDDNGLIFWRLKSYNEEQNILLQGL